jgi:hypothetical protein
MFNETTTLAHRPTATPVAPARPSRARRAAGGGANGRAPAAGAFAAVAALALSPGCGAADGTKPPSGDWPDDGRWWSGGGEAAPGAGGEGGEGGAGEVDFGLLAGEVRLIFGRHCAPCHAGRRGVAAGDFGDLFDVDAMKARGLIVPGQAELSPLYLTILDGQMPPPGPASGDGAPADSPATVPAVSRDESALLAQWINAGAPPFEPTERAPLTAVEFRARLLDDLAAVPAADRAHVRYVSLYSYSAPVLGVTDQTRVVANLVSWALNALSPARTVGARPTTVLSAADELVALRVDLRDYDLDAADWARIEAAADLVDRAAFPCAVPFLDADLLLGVALNDEHERADGRVESLYANVALRRHLERAGVLGPGQLVFEPRPAGEAAGEPLTSAVTWPDLARSLGADLADNLERGFDRALRACTYQRDVGLPPRCVQRDATAGGGPLWWTMRPSESADVFTDPVGPRNGGLVPGEGPGFQIEGGQALWAWPNGIAGFATFDRQLRLRSSGPFDGNEQPDAVPGVLSTHASVLGCLKCHARGPLPVADELGPAARAGALAIDDDERAFVLRLTRPDEFARVASLDAARHDLGVRATCVRGCATSSAFVPELVLNAFRDLGPEDLATALFLPLAESIALGQADPGLAPYVGAGRPVPRREFVKRYAALRGAAVARGVDEATLQFCAQPDDAPPP